MSKNLKNGFSLAEISIAIIIIGILIIGISNGIDLYNNFKLVTARNLTNNSIVNRMDGLTMWFETTLEKSFPIQNPKNGELLTSWQDIKPNGIKLDLNLVPDSAPNYNSNGINSLPVVNFNGVSQTFQRANLKGSEFLGVDQATFILVYNYVSGDTSEFLWNWGSYVSSLNIAIPRTDNTLKIWYGDGVGAYSLNINRNDFVNKNQIVIIVKDVNTTSVYRNGILVGSQLYQNKSINPNIVSTLTIGGIAGWRFKGTMGEIMIFNRALINSERIDIEKYLSQKWGIKIG